ncbi:helicase [Thalassospira sp. MBR-102]|uniref:DEAD/DEAH box helicase n=1 Tax=Thalassospira sp. MBR-102 TaxID=3156466 RepID=UPI00339544E6
MFHPLPNGHGIPDELIKEPLFHLSADGVVGLTQAQVSGINAGIASGGSLLLVAPTSSGKTMVGLVAASTWLRGGDGLSQQVVYLVTHRALARQKFNELKSPKYLEIFDIEKEELVLATGDQVVDAGGVAVNDPLSGRFIIATYEKYLALLAGSGHRRDMANICIVADEIQILGDTHRGRAVEVLLTIIRSAQCGQFVGLSAVLCKRDSEAISSWLGVQLVVEEFREIPLTFELRTQGNTHEWSTDGGDEVLSLEARSTDTVEVLNELASDAESHFPVAVFCMTKRRISDLIRAWERNCPESDAKLDFEFEELTSSSVILASSLPKGFGIHTADLIDTEREIVERRLENDQLPIVFATTTLAQGLNFSFKTVIFDRWTRFIFERRVDEPISYSDFHNIAGRAGRMGLQDRGRVIFSAQNTAESRAASRYLTAEIPQLHVGYIDVSDFEAIALQLISAGLATCRNDLFTFLSESLTGYLAKDNIKGVEDEWIRKLDSTLDRLRDWGFLQ